MYCLLPLVVKHVFVQLIHRLKVGFISTFGSGKWNWLKKMKWCRTVRCFSRRWFHPPSCFKEKHHPQVSIDMLWDQLGSIYNSGWGFEQNHQVLTLSGGGDNSTLCRDAVLHICVVVSQIFNFHPLLGEIIQFDSYFSNGLKSPTRYPFCATDSSFISCLWWCNDYMFLDSCCKTQCLSCVLLRRSSKK